MKETRWRNYGRLCIPREVVRLASTRLADSRYLQNDLSTGLWRVGFGAHTLAHVVQQPGANDLSIRNLTTMQEGLWTPLSDRPILRGTNTISKGVCAALRAHQSPTTANCVKAIDLVI